MAGKTLWDCPSRAGVMGVISARLMRNCKSMVYSSKLADPLAVPAFFDLLSNKVRGKYTRIERYRLELTR